MLRYFTSGSRTASAGCIFPGCRRVGVEQAFVDHELWRRQQALDAAADEDRTDRAHFLSVCITAKRSLADRGVLENRDWQNWKESLRWRRAIGEA